MSRKNKNFDYLNLPDYVVFDWDGTINDNMEHCAFAVVKLLENAGVPKTKLKNLKRFPSESDLLELLRKCNKFLTEETLSLLIKDAAVTMDQMSPILPSTVPKVIDLLIFFKSKNIPQIVLSNGAGTRIRNEAKHFDLEYNFAGIFGMDDFMPNLEKPDIRYFDNAINTVGIKGEKCWFFGDSITDVQMGLAKGCKVFFLGEKKTLNKIPKYNIHLKNHNIIILKNYEELLNLICI